MKNPLQILPALFRLVGHSFTYKNMLILCRVSIFIPIFNFKMDCFQLLNFDQQYVPRGKTLVATSIKMETNPIRTAIRVCDGLIKQQVRLFLLDFV